MPWRASSCRTDSRYLNTIKTALADRRLFESFDTVLQRPVDSIRVAVGEVASAQGNRYFAGSLYDCHEQPITCVIVERAWDCFGIDSFYCRCDPRLHLADICHLASSCERLLTLQRCAITNNST